MDLDLIYGPDGLPIKETPYERLQRKMAENDAADANIRINVFLSQAAGSNPLVIAEIERHLESSLPFGLKCDRSMIVYLPNKLAAYWVGHAVKKTAAFGFVSLQRLVDSVKTQYLTHKQFVSTMDLLPVALKLKELRQ